MCLDSVTSLHPRDSAGCLGGREVAAFHGSGGIEAPPETFDPGHSSAEWRSRVCVTTGLGPDAVPSVAPW